MNLAATFKISLYALTALAGLILGMAEGGWIPFGSLLAVVIGYLWSETGSPTSDKPRGMNDAVASVCGFIALLSAVGEFFSENLEGRLLSGTHLVVYLTWIVMLQRKSDRRYWLMLALGALQLAVASVLTSGPSTVWFGLSAILYVFAAVWTMSVFSLYRSASRFTEAPRARSAALAGQSTSLDSVQIADGVTWISSAFITGVLFTGSAGLFVSALFFVLIPRVWMPTGGVLANDDSPTGPARSGFATEVRLGDLGSILERMDPVLQLRLQTSDRAYFSPQDYAERLGLAEPLFRGAVLSDYESSTWRSDPQSNQRPSRLFPISGHNMIRQEIRLEDIGGDTLLCLGIPIGLVDHEEQPRGSYQWVTQLIYRAPNLSRHGSVRYVVYSELPRPGSRSHGEVVVHDVSRNRYKMLGYIHRIGQVPPGLERMAELARQVVARARQRRGTDLTQLETAQAIESFLRDSGEYTYSLHLSVDDPKIDPVEDFLFHRKQGHCEYFASALVLMLRSVGIPARLISGYKGGNYDETTKTLSVQQRHAHAWCEAWIDDESWVTLDATPPDERSASVEAVSANRSVWSSMRAQLTGIWSENVVNISLEKQEEVIYRPIRELVRSMANVLREFWLSPQASLASFFALVIDPRRWFSLTGAGTLFVLIATSWLVYRLIRSLRNRWKGWRRPVADAPARRQIEFYERFTRLMLHVGLRRGESQTQHEFAVQAADALRPRLQLAGLTCSPMEISVLFYKIRFGNEPLPETEARRISDLLADLERNLLQDQPE